MSSPTNQHVEVLLATYNGERFLREQIESILAQDYPELTVLARDDGSDDETVAILRGYATQYPQRFRLLTDAAPTGSAQGNFLRLMQLTDAPYVCFADQDDVWLPHKISRSMEYLKRLESTAGTSIPPPAMVFTDLRVVDEAGRTLHESFWRLQGIRPDRAQRLASSLGQSVVTGCTLLMNRPLLCLARNMPTEATMHDRWIALLAASMGQISYLPEPTVLYRQHGRNVIGAASADASPGGLASRTLNPAGRLQERQKSEAMARALLRLHGDAMPAEQRKIVEAYLESGANPNALRRVWLTVRNGFWRGKALRNAALLWQLLRAPTR